MKKRKVNSHISLRVAGGEKGNVETENLEVVAACLDCLNNRCRGVLGGCGSIQWQRVVSRMSIKEALEGLFDTVFKLTISGFLAIGIICLGVWFGWIPFCAGLAAAIIPLFVMRNKRDKAEHQRLLRPTRYMSDEERYKAIEYLIRSRKREQPSLFLFLCSTL